MLKVTYTETGSHVEQLTQSLEEWVEGWVLLAMRTSQQLVVEQSAATLLLRADLHDLPLLESLNRSEQAIDLCRCDLEFVEVSLQGNWVSSGSISRQKEDAFVDGVFVAILPDAIERLLLELWQISQACPSSLWR